MKVRSAIHLAVLIPAMWAKFVVHSKFAMDDYMDTLIWCIQITIITSTDIHTSSIANPINAIIVE